MATASSLPGAFSTFVKMAMRRESSTGRKFAKDAVNNPTGLTWDTYQDIIRGYLNDARGYTLGAAATAQVLGVFTKAVAGSIKVTAASLGLGTISYVTSLTRRGPSVPSSMFSADYYFTTAGATAIKVRTFKSSAAGAPNHAGATSTMDVTAFGRGA
jgi:hypothetical protein